jgi:hypothetical protein
MNIEYNKIRNWFKKFNPIKLFINNQKEENLKFKK